MGLKPLIKIEGISFGYTQKTVLADIDLSITKGEVVAVLGPNGCGKSNIADALRWVLGNQSPRTLRARAWRT